MIVCHCKGITDRDIRNAVREGAVSRTEVSQLCAAGQGCHGCHPLIDQIIQREGRQTPPGTPAGECGDLPA